MFGEELKRLRQSRGISQREMGEILGVSQSAVGMWESSRRTPDLSMLARLSEVFQIPLDCLLGRGEGLPGDMGMLPIIGTVKAGYDGIAEEENLGYEPAEKRHLESCRYFLVKGDSMEPQILDGDLALVRIQPDVESGDLAVVILNGDEGTIKRVLKKNSALILQPFNPEYETQVFVGRDLENVRIWGKVIETKRKW